MRVKLSAEKVLAGRMIYSILGHAIRGMYACMYVTCGHLFYRKKN